MFCFLYKWFVSSSMDTGKPLQGFVRRHLEGCKGCNAFAASANALHERLGPDAKKLLTHAPTNLNHKIIDALPGFIPSSRTIENQVSNGGDFFKWLKRGRFDWKPAMSMAVAVIVLVVGVWWLTGPGKSPATMDDNGNLIPAIKVDAGTLHKFALNLESPLHKELDILKNAVNSAKDYFVANLRPATRAAINGVDSH